MTIELFTALLGWSLVINIIVLLFSTLMVVLMRETISSIHARLFSLNTQDLGRAYFQYLAQYKIAILVLNLAPYIALKIIT
ncbi:DUF6868 family protein [Oceanisphaera sp. IT1-181]|uniref:DUF6868 family protein n=1 Tax=Oceanisphaera sp. IT1-181 TaxID=3081199 RepID=UPI0029CA189B|nr:hypothetical protein [Oceanisphaera sp. IT1-181]